MSTKIITIELEDFGEEETDEENLSYLIDELEQVVTHWGFRGKAGEFN